LLRWDHENEGVITHYACRDMAESTGMSLTIGPWAFHRACEDLAGRLPADARVRLRLTQMQSSDGNLAAVVNRVIAKTGMPAEQIEIALDARAVIADRGEAQSNLQALRDNGVLVGLHEFTGSHTEFAIVEDEQIKSVILAGSIVPNHHKPASVLTRLTSSMISTLRQLGVAVSVVDVATTEDAAWWHAMGVVRGQGDFTGSTGEVDSLLPERTAPSANGA
jgi:EAL domain-containing protein (putative c-di-GMP-specific phosphodiesterase class I)